MNPIAHGKFSGQRLAIFGCGYLGTAVAQFAMTHGLAVTAVTRNPAKAAALRTEGVETIVADLAGDEWHARLASAEWVLNCVGSGGGGIAGYRHSYRAGMDSVARWARERGGVGTLIYTSSTSVYPQGGGAPVTETAPTGGDERADVLIETEQCVAGAADAWRRWFVLRLAGLYGPGRHYLLEQVRGGEVAGTGERRLNLAHRDDVVAAIWACFTAPLSAANEIFNVADDAPAPKSEVVGWLADRLGVQRPRFTGAPAAGRRATTPDRVIANAKLKAALGWRPVFPSYREGYAAILDERGATSLA